MLCIQGTKQAALLYTGWPGYNRLRQTEIQSSIKHMHNPTISPAHHTDVPCSSYAPTSCARPKDLLLIPLISPAHHQSSSATSPARPKISHKHTNNFLSHPAKSLPILPTPSPVHPHNIASHPHNILCLSPVTPRNIPCSSPVIPRNIPCSSKNIP
jgi:hypothetical protein